MKNYLELKHYEQGDVMKEKTEMLNEIINDGEKISLMDGSVWLINPSDMPTVCTWIPTATIRIKANKSEGMFPFELINENIDVLVCARKLS